MNIAVVDPLMSLGVKLLQKEPKGHSRDFIYFQFVCSFISTEQKNHKLVPRFTLSLSCKFLKVDF